MRRTCVLVFAALVGTASCGRKPAAPAEADKKKEGVGLKDFVDYATGAGPIRHGERIKKQIRETAAEHNRQVEEAMGK